MKNSFKVIDEQFEASKKAMRSYVTGFVLSIILTLVPYYLVVKDAFAAQSLVGMIVVFSVLQLFVQVVFFLHLHPKSRPRWNMIVFLYTLLIIAFLVVGSLWIMYNLNYNMMGISPFNSNEGYIPQ